jgi:hypothetical protein
MWKAKRINEGKVGDGWTFPEVAVYNDNKLSFYQPFHAIPLFDECILIFYEVMC